MLIAELVAPKRRHLKNAVPPVKVAAKRKNAIPRKRSVTAKKPKSLSAARHTKTKAILDSHSPASRHDAGLFFCIFIQIK